MAGRRHWIRRLLVAGLLLGGAIVALPWWLPPVAVWAAGRWGVEVGAWQSRGWSGAIYRDVKIAQPGWSCTLGEVRLPVLGVWPAGASASGEEKLRARDVALEIRGSEQERPADVPRPSFHAIVETIVGVWRKLEEHLPATHIDGLRIVINEAKPVVIHSAAWNGRVLDLAGVAPLLEQTANLRLHMPDTEVMELTAALPQRSASVNATIKLSTDAVMLDAGINWQAAAGTIAVRFTSSGLLPAEATLDAPDLELDAAAIGLAGYGPIRGTMHARWSGSGFSTEARLSATPLEDEKALPPLEVDLRGSGDPDEVRVDALAVSAPGVQMRLSQPVSWQFTEGQPTGEARFAVAADLAQIQWIKGRGQVSGSLTAVREEAGAEQVRFDLAAADAAWGHITLGSLRVAGSWAQSRLTLDECVLKPTDAALIEASGCLDLPGRVLTGVAVKAHLDRAALLGLASNAPEFTAIDLEATADGAWPEFAHRGTVRLRQLAGLPGGAIDADLDWAGKGIAEASLEGAIASALGVTIPVQANMIRDASGDVEAMLTQLEWHDSGGTWWRLQQPTQVRVRDLDVAGEGVRPRIEISKLDLRGDAFHLAVNGAVRWPVEGEINATMGKLAVGRLGGLVPEAVRAVTVDAFDLRANWRDGPVRLEGAARVHHEDRNVSAYAAELAFRSNEDDGRTLTADVGVTSDSGVVFAGTGSLPLVLQGRTNGFAFELPRDGPIALEISSRPNQTFWSSVAALTGWSVTDPRLAASLSGSLASPRGRVAFTAGELAPPRRETGRTELPRLSGVSLSAIADDNGVAVDEALVAIEDRWVRVQGRAPWTAWRAWRDGQRNAWREVTFQLASNPLPVAIASRIVPTVLAPDGEVSLDLRHDPDDGLSGRVWLHGAALRPIAPVGAIRDINASLRLHEYEIELQALTGLIGGRPVLINGRGRVLPGERIDFDLRATATRVPVVRDAGLVVRAGLDVRVERSGPAPAHISGQVDLGPSVYVSDLVSLLPAGGVEAPELRPPFFSVHEEPFADWTLDIAVRGEEFMRVENPLFRGTLSADFHLEGTLGEPRAIGRVTSADGSVAFPFARLPLQHVEVVLSPESPYRPTILASGATRVFGYDVRMEASGNADEPRLLFAADPPLSSQAVFLMLTTGAMPDQSQRFSSNERAQRLALFLGRNLAAGLGLGADSAQDRLTIRSGESFSREGRETLHVQYDLDGRWSLVGEYDRFDAYNGGIKFRLIDR